MINSRHRAVQVLWECKNKHELQARDFHQAAFYMSEPCGKFVAVTFRGEIQEHYYEHVRRVHTNQRGIVLLLTDKDLDNILSMAGNMPGIESILRTRYDETVRKIS